MKKIIVLILATIALHHQVWSQCDIPAKKPGVYVQDHVDKLSSNEERTLEAKIQNYRQKTGIQICIALVETTGDCDGETYARELANTYGVGEKNVNNGLTIMVAWNHKWFIKTGYATESYITDYEAVNIGEANLVPNLRENKVYQAINTTLDACIQEMGWQTWDERIAARQKAEQEAAARSQNFWIWVASLIGLALLLWLGVWIYRREQKRNKIRNQLSSWKKQIKEGRPALNTAGWPNWAMREYQQIQQQFQGAESQFEHEEGGIFAAIDDPDKAYELMSTMERGCINILNKLIGQTNELPGRIQQYRSGAAPKVKGVLAGVQSFQNGAFTAAKKQGFKFTEWDKEVQRHLDELRKWEEQLQNPHPDHYKAAFETATQLEKTFAAITTAFAALMANHETINKETKAWQGRITKIRSNTDAGKIIEQLRSNYPNNVWEALFKSFQQFTTNLNKAEQQLTAAEKKNSLQVQDLAGGWADYQAATALIVQVETLFADITTTLENQKISEAAYPGKKSATNSAISTARSKCSDSDVEGRAKGYLSEAESLYRSATSAAGGGETDWVTICNQLDRAKGKADDAHSQACRDISDAEDARRRRREEEERQRQAAYSSSSSSSSWSTSSDSGSSFGGGSSGGGGGGGSW